jgi:D-alanine transfer protein
MIRGVTAGPRAPHLFASFLSCVIAVAIICAGRGWALYLESKTIHATAPNDFFIKNQGLAFQRAAARASDILLLYGSSELTDPVPNRSPQYFASAPTGFEVCPVGKPGATSLVMLQKLAAIGSDLRRQKVAVSISPSFFFRPDVTPAAYAGNFSLPAASALIFGTRLDRNLKQDIARRMLQFPDTLSKSALLNLATQCLASGGAVDRLAFTAMMPLGWLQNIVFDFQDHFEALVYILSGGKKIPRRELRELLNPGADLEQGRQKGVGSIGHHGEAAFVARITGASEWGDLELLFRTLKAIGAQPFLLSMPFNGALYDSEGVSRAARQVYYDKLEALAQRYNVNVAQFLDHDEDPAFQKAHTEHPTEEGWTFFNQALDAFFHGVTQRTGDRRG